MSAFGRKQTLKHLLIAGSDDIRVGNYINITLLLKLLRNLPTAPNPIQ